MKEHLQAYEGFVHMKDMWCASIEIFINWAFNLIEFHRRNQQDKEKDIRKSIFETKIQLSAFKNFLNIAREKNYGERLWYGL